MKPLLLSIIFSTFAFCDISVIISDNNKLITSKVSYKALANLYLKKTNSINGIHLTPIDSKNKKLYQEFYKKVVKKTPAQLHAYWIKEIYTGKKSQPKRLNENEIKKALKNNRKIIAYSKNPKTGQIILNIK